MFIIQFFFEFTLLSHFLVGDTRSLLHSVRTFQSFERSEPLLYFDLLFGYWQANNFALEKANGEAYALTAANFFTVLLDLVDVDYDQRTDKKCLIWKRRTDVAQRAIIRSSKKR